jgi:hypothetical protein
VKEIENPGNSALYRPLRIFTIVFKRMLIGLCPIESRKTTMDNLMTAPQQVARLSKRAYECELKANNSCSPDDEKTRYIADTADVMQENLPARPTFSLPNYVAQKPYLSGGVQNPDTNNAAETQHHSTNFAPPYLPNFIYPRCSPLTNGEIKEAMYHWGQTVLVRV